MSKERASGTVYILGAGPAGLTAAHFYEKRGHKVTVIEKGNGIGGLSKGVMFQGYKFDLGPHSFYANYSSETKQFFNQFVGKGNYDIVKVSKLLQTKKALFYTPFRPSTVLNIQNFSFFSAYAFYKLIALFSFSKKKTLLDKHGYWLRKKIFRPYCKKYFNLEPEDVSEDFVKLLYANDPNDDGTIYIPHAGYIGILWENVYSDLLAKGVKFEFNQEVTQVSFSANSITALLTKTHLYDDVKCLVSTIPLKFINQLIFPNSEFKGNLNYRATIIVFLEVEKVLTDALYLTNYDLDNIIGRVSFCSNWNKRSDKTVISVEIWCDEKDDIYKRTEQEITDLVINSLSKIAVVHVGELPYSKLIRIPKCFPILEKGYNKNLSKITKELKEISNLDLIGRHGKFQWDGIDDIIHSAHYE